MSFIILRRTAHGARRTAEPFGKTAFAVIALIGGFCTLTFADKTSAQQLPQTSISHTAQSGGGFADFRKQQQARLLAAIDSTLATQAENAITGNFAAVKQADVQLQTELGGRKGNFGINLIGAIDESADSAFGWQLRGYVGPNSVKGANAGAFYRKINNGALFGANAFLDYEDGDYGGFSRFGIGGEVEHKIIALAANYYLPLTDEQNVNSSVMAFSRQGFDAKLRVSAPQFDAVKLAVDYYNFDGERGAKSDDGLRYGVELHPFAGFRLDVLYDDGNEKFGGNIGYSHTIGERQARKNNNGETFAPDMFAVVSREYSQRIATAAIITIASPMTLITSPLPPTMTTAPPVINTNIVIMTMRTTTAITAAAITTTARMTAEVTTTITTFPLTGVATRVASVQATLGVGFNGEIPVSTYQRFLVTLPPASNSRPYTAAIEGDFFDATNNPDFRSLGNQSDGNFSSGNQRFTISVVEGSEIFISVTVTLTTRTTTTMAGDITETPMTMAAVSTTTRITTFSTMFITLTANTAMGDMGDSRFRGNDEGGGSYEMAALDSRFHGNDEKGGNDKQPSFPRRRESKPLSFVYLRDSANGDLSPQMANRRVRKARS
ncbi:MAG: inverse autotransporter beta domain-containing protein [Gammaproteobacteria bacterium]